MKKEEIKYIPCVPQSVSEEDEIDLKELIKTILKYKNFILTFTFLITLFSGIYVYTITPVYQIKANLKIGHINIITNENINKLYLLNPYSIIIYIKNTYHNSSADLLKNSKNILTITIQNSSNKKALETLYKIKDNLKTQEQTKINSYIQNINNQIAILQNYQKTIYKQLNNMQKQLNNQKNFNIFQILLNTIQNYQNDLLNTKLTINKLQEKISPINIDTTHIIGTIKQNPYPIKPKKKFIIIIAFITGFIVSIFLVFFMEFIKNLKEEN